MKPTSLLASLALVVTAPLAAQTICVTGIVDPAPAFSTCAAAASHQLRCSGLRLNSTTIGLQQYEGQIVEVCGTVTGAATCRVMTVTAVHANPASLTITGAVGGKVKLGGKVSLLFQAPPPAFWFLWIGTAPGWTPAPPFGYLLLGSPFQYVTSGLVGSAGSSSLPLTVPNDPFLVGANFHFQAGFLDLSTFGAALRNTDCFGVTP